MSPSPERLLEAPRRSLTWGATRLHKLAHRAERVVAMADSPGQREPAGLAAAITWRSIGREDAQSRRAARGTSGGEYMRRFWHPIALSSQVRDLPKRVRILGEDAPAVFRDLGGRLGLPPPLHCSHRGTSLEFGVLTERGISCCYHRLAPRHRRHDPRHAGRGQPAAPSRERVCHGAYPVREHGGLIFGYFGAPETMPPFFLTDATVVPDNELYPPTCSRSTGN